MLAVMRPISKKWLYSHHDLPLEKTVNLPRFGIYINIEISGRGGQARDRLDVGCQGVSIFPVS